MTTLSETPGAGQSTVETAEANSHLSYYTHEKSASPPPVSTPPPARELSKTRLYVGNLHPSIDEYTFVQVFNKYGKIAKLDFLFHKSGPSKGKPRGYAFVEYADKEDALRALVNAHDKLLRGKKLVVTYANQAPTYETCAAGPGKHRRMDTQHPTALSLIKSSSRPGRMEDKIAAFEAKLRQMKKSSASAASSLPSHPSLPLKPPPSLIPPDAPIESAKTAVPHAGNPQAKSVMKGGGPFSSRTSTPLGKKPTLDELMQAKKKATMQGGLLKR